MQQILQNIRSGALNVHDVPAPMVRDGQVLIANQASIISAGTEKMDLDLSKKSLLGKARERPDHVRRVLEKMRNEGLWQTVQQVREKLDSPMTMGYSSAGVLLACGREPTPIYRAFTIAEAEVCVHGHCQSRSIVLLS